MMKKTISLLLALLMMLALFAGCGGNGQSASSAPTAAPATDAPAPVASAQAPQPEPDDTVFPFPMEETFEVSLLMGVAADFSQYAGDAEEYVFYNTLAEKFNLNFEITAVDETQFATQFNIIVAGGELPDILANVESNYPTGFTGALSDEVIIDLAGYLDYMPNYAAIISDEDIARDAYTDGHLGTFYKIYEENYGVLSGPLVRADWLAALDMDMPVTFDDWTSTLEAFKVEYSPKYCLALSGYGVCTAENLSSGFGVRLQYWTATFNSSPFYVTDGKDGTVHFGPTEPGCLEYLTLLSSWYKAGYFDSDFVNFTGWNVVSDEVPVNDVGIAFGAPNKVMSWEAQATDPNFELIALSDPTRDGVGKEYVNHWKTRIVSEGWSVSTSCEEPKKLIQLIDWLYSEEGYLLSNYGTEHDTFEYDANGTPRLTEKVMNHEALTVASALGLYGGATSSPHLFNISKEYSDVQFAMFNTWNAVNKNADNWAFPANASMTEEEEAEYSAIMTDVLTYISENFLAFIMGERELDTFEDFVKQVKDMNVDQAVAIKQAALDRYNGN